RSSIYKLLLSVFKMPVSSPPLALAGAGAGTGAAGALGAIANQTLGGGDAGSFLTGGFAGGNPAAAAISGTGGGRISGAMSGALGQAGGIGGFLRKLPGIGGLFGGGKKSSGAEMIGGLPVFKDKFPVQLSGMPDIGGIASTAGKPSGIGGFLS